MLVSTISFTQQFAIPDKVTEAFKKYYPEISDIKWDKEGSSEFEASFKENGKDISVVFDKAGKLEETETSIQISELPENAVKFINTNYSDSKITEAAKIVKANGAVLFEAEVTMGKQKKDLLFDPKGELEKNGSVDNEADKKDED
jgi:hypothetical protein